MSDTNNLMANESYGICSIFSTTVFSSAVLLFQENECQHTNAKCGHSSQIQKGLKS